MAAAETTAALPEFTTTVLPSNGQLLAEETDELLAASLAAMKADLAANPAWSGAPSPKDEFLLMFLRAEVFSPPAAANRYRKFWKAKITLCGEEKAALPIKFEDARAALESELVQLVPGTRDIEGRQARVVMIVSTNMDKTLERRLRLLSVWYVLLAALEDVETQRRGFCFVGYQKAVKRSQTDPTFVRMVMQSLQGALPVRIGSINICYPPTFFRVVWAIISPFLHERVKRRVRVIPGTDAEVLSVLGTIVPPDGLPPPMGPKPKEFSAWLAEQAQKEA
ncbi:unnamed protein product [Ectocarpus fasciculatus]